MPTAPGLVMLFRVGSRLCALPLEQVAEVIRPLPLQPLAGLPPFASGLSIIRGGATPVVHAGLLLGATDALPPTRVIVLKSGKVALAVDSVVGVRDLGAAGLEPLPPAVEETGPQVVSGIGTLGTDVLLLLRTGPLEQLLTGTVATGLSASAEATR